MWKRLSHLRFNCHHITYCNFMFFCTRDLGRVQLHAEATDGLAGHGGPQDADEGPVVCDCFPAKRNREPEEGKN